MNNLIDKTGDSIWRAIFLHWIRYFCPMRTLESDQEGGAETDSFARNAERFSVTLRFKGSQGHTGTGVTEKHIDLVKIGSLKTYHDIKKEGLMDIQKVDIVSEVASTSNVLFPSYEGAAESSPDYCEQMQRMRMFSKIIVMKTAARKRSYGARSQMSASAA